MSFSQVDYLYQVVDYYNPNTVLYQCGKREVELDLGFSRPSVSYQMPGEDAPYDPNGADGNPMAPRQVKFKFSHLYDASLPTPGGAPTATYKTRRTDFNRAVAHGRRVYLVLLDTDGVQWYGAAKLVDAPNRITETRRVLADFEGSFELNPPVFRSLFPAGWAFADSGLLSDNGVVADNNTLPTLALNAFTQQMVVTNNGDADERYLRLLFTGPLAGPLTLYNVSILSATGQALTLVYNGSLAFGQTLVFDIAANTWRLNGVPWFDPQRSFRLKGQREWFFLRAGDNTIQVNLGNYPLSGAVVTDGGLGYLSVPAVTVSGGGGQGAAFAPVFSGGILQSLTLVSPGFGYTSAPTITFTGGTPTRAAAATAMTAFGQVGYVTVANPGVGYLATPSVTITPVHAGVGSGASAIALMSGGTVVGVRLLAPGSGYDVPPTVAFVGGTPTTAASATATLGGSLVVDARDTRY